MGEVGGHVAMVTYHRGGEAVAVGGYDSTLTACKQLTTVRHPGTTSYLRREQRFTMSHLADAFIQSHLQIIKIEAIKTIKRAIMCKCSDKSRLA